MILILKFNNIFNKFEEIIMFVDFNLIKLVKKTNNYHVHSDDN